MYENEELLALIDQIPYEERSLGSDTTKELARMLVEKEAQKMARSKQFQAESREKNRTMFSAQPPPQAGPPPGSALVHDAETGVSNAPSAPGDNQNSAQSPAQPQDDSFELGDL